MTDPRGRSVRPEELENSRIATTYLSSEWQFYFVSGSGTALAASFTKAESSDVCLRYNPKNGAYIAMNLGALVYSTYMQVSRDVVNQVHVCLMDLRETFDGF